MKLPKYTGKDYYVLALILLPVSVILSYAAMGRALFAEWRILLAATFIGAVVLGVYFTGCGWWAVAMKQRFPRESDTGRKLFFMIAAFLVMSGLVLLFIFHLFERIPFFQYTLDRGRFIWAYLGLGFVNIFLSFLFEGISRFEEWKVNLRRKEQLQRAFQQSQLQGLRNQVNPHFLFNSLNALSGLIEEDTGAAERFLDEMSKVYRYMLRPEAEQLAPLRAEMLFMESYFHLLKVRFGESLHIRVNVDPAHSDHLVPALTLPAIVENAISQNIVSRKEPLVIEIGTGGDGMLFVRHNINPKTTSGTTGQEARLDELIRKHELLYEQVISVRSTDGYRTIVIPFVNTTEALWK